MLTNVKVTYKNGIYYERDLKLPHECPHCGETMIPYVWGGFSEFDNLDAYRTIGVLAQCTNQSCKKFFALEFRSNSDSANLENTRYAYRPDIKISLPKNLDKVSPSFVQIFTQSLKAECENLNQIAGVGYRKSLEFLIKDFAIYKNKEAEDDIAKRPLVQVINEYYGDFPRIQSLAKASAWIGNDETHYIRKYENLDVSTLKSFILAAAHFISGDYAADIAADIIQR